MGDASPLHPNAAAALGTPARAALLLARILPVLPPHRANHARRGPRFSVVAPCRRGASLVSVRRQTFATGCRPAPLELRRRISVLVAAPQLRLGDALHASGRRARVSPTRDEFSICVMGKGILTCCASRPPSDAR